MNKKTIMQATGFTLIAVVIILTYSLVLETNIFNVAMKYVSNAPNLTSAHTYPVLFSVTPLFIGIFIIEVLCRIFDLRILGKPLDGAITPVTWIAYFIVYLMQIQATRYSLLPAIIFGVIAGIVTAVAYSLSSTMCSWVRQGEYAKACIAMFIVICTFLFLFGRGY